MADADVPITAGAGTKIDTRTVGAGTDEHRQVVVIGDPATATDVAGVTATNGVKVDVTRSPNAGTATLANVGASVTSVTLQASNAARLGLMMYNDSTSACYVKFGTTASATSFTVLMGPGAYYESPNGDGMYTGRVDGIWVAANGNMRLTELTA
jgi:hypothetical protein